jgi:hypothetical protein
MAPTPYAAVIAGPFLLATGVCWEASESAFIANSRPTTALVIQMDGERPRKQNRMYYRPMFEVILPDGSKQRYAGNEWISPTPHVTGETVSARYSKESGRISSDKLIAFHRDRAKMLMVYGGSMLVLGLAILWWRRRRRSFAAKLPRSGTP